jgi:hypothetical protein
MLAGIAAIDAVGEAHGVPLPDAALQVPLMPPNVVNVIPGAIYAG